MRVVIRLGSLPPWVALSGGTHLAVVVAMLLIAGWQGRNHAFEPTVSVQLVGAIPGLDAVTPAPTPTPAPQKEPEQEPVVETAPPPPVKKPDPPKPADVKPAEKPKPEKDPKPEEEPTPTPPAPTPEVDPEPGDPPNTGGATSPGEAAAALGATGVGAVEGIGDEFNWYKIQLIGALRRAWRRPVLHGLRTPLEVPVSFTLLRDGRVESPQLLSSSGVFAMDDSVRRALLQAQLPPLPPAIATDRTTVRTTFVLFPEEAR